MAKRSKKLLVIVRAFLGKDEQGGWWDLERSRGDDAGG